MWNSNAESRIKFLFKASEDILHCVKELLFNKLLKLQFVKNAPFQYWHMLILTEDILHTIIQRTHFLHNGHRAS